MVAAFRWSISLHKNRKKERKTGVHIEGRISGYSTWMQQTCNGSSNAEYRQFWTQLDQFFANSHATSPISLKQWNYSYFHGHLRKYRAHPSLTVRPAERLLFTSLPKLITDAPPYSIRTNFLARVTLQLCQNSKMFWMPRFYQSISTLA